MKRFDYAVFLVIFSLFSPSRSYAGGSGSHAGGFVACQYSQDEKVYDRASSFELADVYEGRVFGHYTYRNIELFANEKGLRKVVAGLLPADLNRFLRKELPWLEGTIGTEKTDTPLEESEEVKNEVLKSLDLPKYCAFFQVAAFFDASKQVHWTWKPVRDVFGPNWEIPAHVDVKWIDTRTGETFDGDWVTETPEMSLEYQLKLHEGIYHYAREKCGDKDSRRTRAIVAVLLSDIIGAKEASRSGMKFSEFMRTEQPRIPDVVHAAYKRKRREALRRLKTLLTGLQDCRPF